MDECPHTQRIESRILGGELGEQDRRHLADCPACRGVVAAITTLQDEGRAARREAAARLPPPATVLAVARAEAEPPRMRLALWPILLLEWVTALFAMLTLVGLVWWVVARRGDAWTGALRQALSGGIAGDASSASILVAALMVLAAVIWGLGGGNPSSPRT